MSRFGSDEEAQRWIQQLAVGLCAGYAPAGFDCLGRCAMPASWAYHWECQTCGDIVCARYWDSRLIEHAEAHAKAVRP